MAKKRAPKQYETEFKLGCVDEYLKGGVSVADVAKSAKIPLGTLNTWLKRYPEGSATAAKPSKRKKSAKVKATRISKKQSLENARAAKAAKAQARKAVTNTAKVSTSIPTNGLMATARVLLRLVDSGKITESDAADILKGEF